MSKIEGEKEIETWSEVKVKKRILCWKDSETVESICATLKRKVTVDDQRGSKEREDEREI